MSRQVDNGQPQPQQPQPQQPGEGEETVMTSQPEGSGQAPWIMDGVDDTFDVVDVPAPAPAAPPTQPQAPAPAPAPTPTHSGQYEIRTPTGFVFRGNTPEEVILAADRYYSNISQAPGQQPQYQPAPIAPQQHSMPSTPPSQWSDETFYKTFAANPRAALDMFLNERFGDLEDFLGRVDTSYSISTQVNDRIAIADFMANNVDYPASPQSGDMLMKRLVRDGVELTSWNLEVAYRQLVREGVLNPVQPEAPPQQPDYRQQYGGGGQPQPSQPQQYQQPQPQPQPQTPPPPPPRRGSGAPPAPPSTPAPVNSQLGDTEITLAQFEALNPIQMRQYMQRRRELGHTFSYWPSSPIGWGLPPASPY